MGSGFLKREPSALLNGLWLPKWEGDPIKEGIYIYRQFTFLYSRNLTQYYKATILQYKF